jgi:hypothetical protein
MLNQLSNLTSGIFASGGLVESIEPFNLSECLSSLSDIEDDVTIALDMLDTLNEQYDAPVMVNLKWSMMIMDYACLLMGLRELARKVRAQLQSSANMSSDAVVVLNATSANQSGGADYV